MDIHSPTQTISDSRFPIHDSRFPISDPRVSILIVNWNGKHHLPECLDSLAGQTFRDFEVVLVDNGSTDGSAALVRDGYPWVRLVELPENCGFAGGNNAAYARALGDCLVTLNNDTIAEPGWLAELTRVADAHPDAGMIASRIVSAGDPEIIDSLGVTICPDGMSRGARRNRRFASFALPPVSPILLPSACAALYRRAMLDETGFFDERYFAYCEDTDLGLRGRRAGWQAYLARDAVVRHKYSQTGGRFSPLKLTLVERNHLWVAARNFPVSMLLALPFWTAVRFAVQASLLGRGTGVGGQFHASGARGQLLRALLKGVLTGWAGLFASLHQRRTTPDRLPPGELAALLREYRLSFRELLEG
jgi:GT2 family glycosyltransferase